MKVLAIIGFVGKFYKNYKNLLRIFLKNLGFCLSVGTKNDRKSAAEIRIENLLANIEDYALAVDYFLTALGPEENEKPFLV